MQTSEAFVVEGPSDRRPGRGPPAMRGNAAYFDVETDELTPVT
jgi:hypothetical protein